MAQGTVHCIKGNTVSPPGLYIPTCPNGERMIQGDKSTCTTAQAVIPPGFTLPECPDGEQLEQGTNKTCNDINTIPNANAGADQRDIAVGTAVILDGTGSWDADGDNLSYLWMIKTKPAGSMTVFSDATLEEPTFSPDKEGSYMIELVVSDEMAESVPSSVEVTAIACADPITHNGSSYCKVTSATGRVWLDRNLGATQACTEHNDTACYGDYYQWGRKADGHEKLCSKTTTVQAADVENAGIKFITGDWDWASVDSDGDMRSTNWSAVDGSSVCPADFRVPTDDELDTERKSWESNNSGGAFESLLRWPSAGSRSSNGQFGYVDHIGYVWSTSASDSPYSRGLSFSISDASVDEGARSMGMSIRCIQPIPPMIIDDNFDNDAVGTLPPGWIIKYNGTGDANQKVIDTVYKSPDHSFQIEGRSGWAASIYKTPAAIPDKVTVKSNIYVVSGVAGSFTLNNKDIGPWGTFVGGLQFKDGKFSAFYSGGNIYEITAFTPQQWYHVKIVYDNPAKTYQIYIDGALASGTYDGTSYTTFPMHPSVSPAQVALGAGYFTTAKVFFDDVKMY